MKNKGGSEHRLVAVVESHPEDRKAITDALARADCRAVGFTHCAGFMEFADTQRPDLIVLDPDMPDRDGLDACREIWNHPGLAGVPVIVISENRSETDRLLMLEMCAVDCICKPFSARELAVRVKAQFRLCERCRDRQYDAIKIGGLSIDLKRYSVTIAGKPVELTPTEFRLLKILATRPGWVMSRDQILDELWGEDRSVIDRTVDFHITKLRSKLGSFGSQIASVRGVGYKLGD